MSPSPRILSDLRKNQALILPPEEADAHGMPDAIWPVYWGYIGHVKAVINLIVCRDEALVIGASLSCSEGLNK